MTIKVNGKTYQGLEDMPMAERQDYARSIDIDRDDNDNGIPDILDEMMRKANLGEAYCE